MNPTLTGATFAEDFLSVLEIGSGARRSSNLRILDVGTGTGRIPIEICSRRPGFLATCVDRSPGACNRSRRHVAAAGLSGAIEVTQANACSLPCDDKAFDAVISNALVHHIPDQLKMLRECLRVLRPGGLIFVRDALKTGDAGLIEQILSRRGQTDEAPASSPRRIGLLTLQEARHLAVQAGLPAEWVGQRGRRHWIICGRLPDSSV